MTLGHWALLAPILVILGFAAMLIESLRRSRQLHWGFYRKIIRSLGYLKSRLWDY